MKWYEGGIAQAVALSQSQKAVFFVGIFGTDGPSQELEAALNSDEVQVVLASDEFVCLRLEAESEPHKQFAAIYANAKTPSIYCITDKGVPVEIITETLPTAELRERLESARNRHRQVLGIMVQGSSTTTFAVPPQPASVSTATATATTAAAKAEETKEEPEQPESPSGSSSETQGPAFEEKVRRAKELALARQLQKQKEEEEDERRKEIERRQAGKGMAELQRWQKEQEAKKILEERKKEREEEKLVRQRLREQIAQDRAARNARPNTEFVEQASSSVPKPTVTSNAAANYAGQARLQFRLPDGSSVTHAFSPDSTLGHVRQFLIDGATVPFRNFSLWVAFPRRQFTSAEFGNTLRELGLLPSAALLILPDSGLSNTRPGGSSNLWALIAYLLGYILYPVSFIWSVLQRALPSSTTEGTNSGPSSSASTEKPTGSVLGRGNKLGGRAPTDGRGDQAGSSSSTTPSSGDNPGGKAKDKSSSASSSSSSSGGSNSSGGKNLSSPDGNVHRLRTRESDSDDEKATWNGNSTQQM